MLFLTDVFWAFSFHCSQKFGQDFPRERTFRWKRVLAELSFSVLCSSFPLTVPKHLDSCSTFHKAVVTSRAFPSHFVSWFYGLDRPQAPTPNVESGSTGKCCCSLEVFSWMLCFITNKECAASSKILNFFIHAPLLLRDDVRCNFPGLCGVSETTMWHSHQAP